MEGDPEMESLLAQRQALLDQMKAQGLEPASKKDGPSRGTSWHSSQTGSQQQFPSLPPPDTPSEQTSPVRQTFPDTVQDSAPETQQPQSQTGQPVQIKKPEESQASQSQSLESKKPAESQASQSQSFESKKPAESQAAQSQSLESKKPAESQAAQSQSLVPNETKTPEQAATGQDGQAKAKAQAKRLLPNSKARPGQTKDQDDEYCLGEEDEAVAPPAQVSKATLMKRLARLCTPREDGSYKIPQDVINTYKILETREQVYRSFEKCGCVLFSKRINRKYEEINEKSVETEFDS
ncbi:unnamed protein product [Symbiodinium sp. CCMP2592]|nr:unnamed protein product [Symbiodinium sp. CCMP2592]